MTLKRTDFIGTQTTTHYGSANNGAYLHKLIVGKAVSTATITVYDGPAANGKTRAVIDGNVVATHHFDGAFFKDGIYIVTGTANPNLTVVYE